MKKKVFLLFFVLLSFVLFPNVFSQQINASIIFAQENYSVGDKLNISFLLNFSDLSPDWFFESSEGHKISLRELLRNNGKPLPCEIYNCERRLSNISREQTSVFLNPSSQMIFGFYIKDNNFISFEDIFFRFSTNFHESPSSQLGILIANHSAWEFFSQTDNYNSFFSSGCFDYSKPFSFNKQITDTRYCEKMSSIPQTKKVLLGANFSNNLMQNKVIKMTLLNRFKSEVASCYFNSSEKNFCTLNFTDKIEGDYYVCISSVDTNTELFLGFQENQQNSCGLFGSSSSNGDYSIFLRLPTYSSFAGQINLTKSNFSSGIDFRVNNYLNFYYGKNCSLGCFVPFVFFGNQQNLNLQEAKLSFRSSSGITLLDKFYNLSELPVLESFSGVLSLDNLGFTINSPGQKNISFFLSKGEQRIFLFSRRINVSSRPSILDLYPKKVPSRVNVTLNLEYFSALENVSNFVWRFVEDNVTKTTFLPRVSYIFFNSSIYTIELTLVMARGENISSIFFVEAFPPKNISEIILNNKIILLENVTRKIDSSFSSFLSTNLKEVMQLNSLKSRLDGLKNSLDDALLDEDLLKLADEIFSLSVPSNLSVEMKEDFLFFTSEQISSDALRIVLGKNSSEAGYKEYVSHWSVSKLTDKSKKTFTKIKLLDEKNRNIASLAAINVQVEPLEDAILVFSSNNLIASSLSGENEGNNFKKILLNKNSLSNLELLYNGTAEPTILIFPKELAKVQLSIKNLEACNFNKICEKNIGENYKNCRNDCKPWGTAIFLIILIFIVTFVLYFLIVSKLKESYEKNLFKSQRDLLNVVSFFKSFEEKGLSRQEAIEKLVRAGWSREQAVYASKKAKGERTRPYEIIPIDKIKMIFNKK